MYIKELEPNCTKNNEIAQNWNTTLSAEVCVMLFFKDNWSRMPRFSLVLSSLDLFLTNSTIDCFPFLLPLFFFLGNWCFTSLIGFLTPVAPGTDFFGFNDFLVVESLSRRRRLFSSREADILTSSHEYPIPLLIQFFLRNGETITNFEIVQNHWWCSVLCQIFSRGLAKSVCYVPARRLPAIFAFVATSRFGWKNSVKSRRIYNAIGQLFTFYFLLWSCRLFADLTLT